MNETACCFTGHRTIPPESWEPLHGRLMQTIDNLYASGIRTFYAGGALGFDTISAEAVVSYRLLHPEVRLVLAIPCRNQTRRWKQEAVARYEKMLAEADKTIYVSEQYDRECMQRRNEFMVDHSSVCVCYLTKTRGGTANTVVYAVRQGLEVVNIAYERKKN